MPTSVRLNCSQWFLHSKVFCCCIPVRAGVIIMTTLGMLVSGALSVGLWYRISIASMAALEPEEKGIFVGLAVMQTLLFVISILGFVGTVVRKQLFVHIYAWGMYIHFLINVAVAGYVFYFAASTSSRATSKLCQTAIDDADAQEQCSDLVGTFKYVIVGIELAVVLLEFEGVIIVTRYLNNLKQDKFTKRMSRMPTTGTSINSRYSGVPNRDIDQQDLISHSHSHSPEPSSVTMHKPYASEDYDEEFNPYQETELGARRSMDPWSGGDAPLEKPTRRLSSDSHQTFDTFSTSPAGPPTYSFSDPWNHDVPKR